MKVGRCSVVILFGLILVSSNCGKMSGESTEVTVQLIDRKACPHDAIYAIDHCSNSWDHFTLYKCDIHCIAIDISFHYQLNGPIE